MPYIPLPTTGLGIPAKIQLNASAVNLSLSGTNTFQIIPSITDASGAIQAGTALTLSSVAAASGGTSVYTGTITGGAANAFLGTIFVVSGFVNGVNNGSFECSASTATTLTLTNAAGIAETAAATAKPEEAGPVYFTSYGSSFVTVSASGLVTGVAKGSAHIEVCYPNFGNTLGLIVKPGSQMHGLPSSKIYAELRVTVKA